MNDKTMFSFWLDNKTKERLKVISKHRNRSIAYLTNDALVEGLKVWEEKLKRYNENKSD